jgi:CRP/FNR family transcriptional regulator, cyclic AMP receptor protein
VTKFLILDELDDADTRLVIAAARRRRYKRGEAICREGDPGDTLHLLDKGHVAIRVTTPAGDTATMRVIGPGSHFGEMAVLESVSRSATVVAIDTVETLVLHRDVINQLRAQHHSVDQAMLLASLKEVRRLSNALTEALYLPVPRRLARTLDRLTEVFADGIIPLTQDDLAGLTGTTRQTANEVLQQLVADGAITVSRGKVVVIDRDRLGRAAR